MQPKFEEGPKGSLVKLEDLGSKLAWHSWAWNHLSPSCSLQIEPGILFHFPWFALMGADH